MLKLMILLWFNETVVEKDSVRENMEARPNNRMLITARSGDDDEPVIFAVVRYR